MSGYLSKAQVDSLLLAIKPTRVGTDGKGHSHVEAYEIRAHLNRTFGFARWSADLLSSELVFEQETPPAKQGEKSKWTVCYRATLRLTVCDPEEGDTLATYTEAATGDATNQPSRADAHDLALKTAESQAFKRCAANLGDQFGLSLYRKGSKDALVVRTLVMPDAANGDGEADERVDAHVTETPPEEGSPAQSPAETRERSTPPPAAEPVGEDDGRVAQGRADVIREQALAALDTNVPPKKALGTLLRLQTELVAARMKTIQVANREGEPTTLGALVEWCVKQRANGGESKAEPQAELSEASS